MSEQHPAGMADRLAASDHPLAVVFCGLLEAIDNGDGEGGTGLLGELVEMAGLYGYDELAAATEEIWHGFGELDHEQRRQQIELLVSCVPPDLELVEPVVDAEPTRPFAKILQGVPGIGASKVRRLKAAGITDPERLRAAGISGLVAIRGISAMQAEMLLNECAAVVAQPAFPVVNEAAVLCGLEERILGEHFDSELVGIYLDSTIDRCERLREMLSRPHLDPARQAIGALIVAANDMGYEELLEIFAGVQRALCSSEPQLAELDRAGAALQRVAAELRRLQSRLRQQEPVTETQGQPGTPEAPPGRPGNGALSTALRRRLGAGLEELDSTFQQLRNDMHRVIDRVVKTGEVSPLNASALRSFISRLDNGLAGLARVAEQLDDNPRAAAQGRRLAPVAELFAELQDEVKVQAAQWQRQVELRLEGGDILLTAEVLEQLREPLVQLVANAVKHGIEAPADREAAGKPVTGRLTVKASGDGHEVCLEVADDGRGIDLDRLRSWLIEHQVASAAEVAELSEPELLMTLMRPGFSTAEEVSDAGGLGIGLDTVQQRLEALHGRFEVFTKAGHGTRFTLHLPIPTA